MTAASESEQLRCESVLSPISAEKLCPLTPVRWFPGHGFRALVDSRVLEFNFMTKFTRNSHFQPTDPSSAGSAQHGSQARSQGVE